MDWVVCIGRVMKWEGSELCERSEWNDVWEREVSEMMYEREKWVKWCKRERNEWNDVREREMSKMNELSVWMK